MRQRSCQHLGHRPVAPKVVSKQVATDQEGETDIGRDAELEHYLDDHNLAHFQGAAVCGILYKLFIGRFCLVLSTFIDLPEHWQGVVNEYIRTGYRLNLRKRDCARSIFRWHNETLNIHTHLLAFLYFAYLLVSTFFWLQEEHGQDRYISHFVVFCVYILSAMQCLGFSTVYHTFGCHSFCTFGKLLSMDYSGITGLICGSQIPPIFYLFYHHPMWQRLYLAGLFSVSVISYVATHNERYQDAKHTWFRVLCFASNALYALVCFAHVAFLPPGEIAISPDGQSMLLKAGSFVGMMYLSYGLGVMIYVLRIPERWSPGAFDYVLSSHQIWHVFVFLGALCQFHACVGFYNYAMLDAHAL